jgi:hypothetical protein
LEIKWSEYEDKWADVKRSARTTISREGSGKYPTDSWKKQILLAEHSPIRKIHFSWKWTNLFYWVQNHFVRHKFGVEWWCTTQRDDRTKDEISRNDKPQSSFVELEGDADAQALINISRRRLCAQASPETREAWIEVKDEVTEKDPILGSVMVKECIYRGFCPESLGNGGCGYVDTPAYQKELMEYRNINI